MTVLQNMEYKRLHGRQKTRLLMVIIIIALSAAVIILSFHPKMPDLLAMMDTDSTDINETFEAIQNLEPTDPRVIRHIQQNNLQPPSSEDYNLQYSSSSFPDLLNELFGNKKNGFFVECGAYDGQTNSNTLTLEKDQGWNGLLIEANPLMKEAILSKHRKAWFADVCLSPFRNISTIEFSVSDKVKHGDYISKLAMPDDVDLTTDKFIKQFGYGFTNYGTVKCFPLLSIMRAINVSHIDFLSLDVQGVEMKILKTFPYDDTLTIDYILVEHELVPEGADELEKFVVSKGYDLIHRLPADFIFRYKNIK